MSSLKTTFPIAASEKLNQAETAVLGTANTNPSCQQRYVKAVATGEFRSPQAGEWFLSGAIIEAYRAKTNLFASYHIAKLVVARQTTVEIIEEL